MFTHSRLIYTLYIHSIYIQIFTNMDAHIQYIIQYTYLYIQYKHIMYVFAFGYGGRTCNQTHAHIHVDRINTYCTCMHANASAGLNAPWSRCLALAVATRVPAKAITMPMPSILFHRKPFALGRVPALLRARSHVACTGAKEARAKSHLL